MRSRYHHHAHAGQRAVALAATIVEQGEQAYGKHMVKEGEEPVPDTLKNAFLRIQNGADVRGVVLDGACRHSLE